MVDIFYEIIQSNNLYLISNSSVKVANTKFNSSTNPYEIVLQGSSTIIPFTCVQSAIPEHDYHIKSIESLETFPVNSLVDVIGIVVSINITSSTIRKKNGTESKKM